MKGLIKILVVISMFFTCENSQKEKYLSEDAFNIKCDAFVSKISSFKFIRLKEIELEKIDPTFEHLNFRINNYSQCSEYIIIQVGRLTKFRFEVFFNFHCSIRNKKIYLYNPYMNKLEYIGKL
jgi:hypothetical protein